MGFTFYFTHHARRADETHLEAVERALDEFDRTGEWPGRVTCAHGPVVWASPDADMTFAVARVGADTDIAALTRQMVAGARRELDALKRAFEPAAFEMRAASSDEPHVRDFGPLEGLLSPHVRRAFVASAASWLQVASLHGPELWQGTMLFQRAELGMTHNAEGVPMLSVSCGDVDDYAMVCVPLTELRKWGYVTYEAQVEEFLIRAMEFVRINAERR